MFGKSKMINSFPSDVQAREKLNLYIYEYLYHIGAVKAAQGLCADMKWEPNKVTVGEAPGFLIGWWCVFWDLYNAAPERRDQQPHSEEAEAFYQYGLMNSNGTTNLGNPVGPPMDPMIGNPNVSFYSPSGPPSMMPQFPRFPSAPNPRAMLRLPLSQPDYSSGGSPALPPVQIDPNRSNLRMNSPVTRLPPATNHPVPMPNGIYRPGGPRIYSNNSPVSYVSSPGSYHTSNHPPVQSPQESNSNEMPQYSMMHSHSHPSIPMYHNLHFPSNNSPMGTNDRMPSNYIDETNNDTTEILRIKESMQEEMRKFHQTSTNSTDEDFNCQSSNIG